MTRDIEKLRAACNAGIPAADKVETIMFARTLQRELLAALDVVEARAFDHIDGCLCMPCIEYDRWLSGGEAK